MSSIRPSASPTSPEDPHQPSTPEKSLFSTYVQTAFDWLAETFGSSKSIDRHIEVMREAPDPVVLSPLNSPRRDMTTPIELAVDFFSGAIGQGASVSSSRKGSQIKAIRDIAKEVVTEAFKQQIERFGNSQPANDVKEAKNIVEASSKKLERLSTAKLLPPPTYSASLEVEKIVTSLAKPIAMAIFLELQKVDKKGGLKVLLDRFTAQIDAHATALVSNDFSLDKLQLSNHPGWHPLLRHLSSENFKDPDFTVGLESVLNEHFDYIVGTLLNKETRERLFKELFRTREEWLSDIVGDTALLTLIRDENHFAEVGEWAFQYFLDHYKQQTIEIIATTLVEFTETEKLKQIFYGSVIPSLTDLIDPGKIPSSANPKGPTNPSTAAPSVYGHLANQLVFGVVFNTPKAAILGKPFEMLLTKVVGSAISSIRDDPRLLDKLIMMVVPPLQTSLGRTKLYEMLTDSAPPKKEPPPREQLEKLAENVLLMTKEITGVNLITQLLTKEALADALEQRIDLLFDNHAKNLNLVLQFLQALK